MASGRRSRLPRRAAARFRAPPPRYGAAGSCRRPSARLSDLVELCFNASRSSLAIGSANNKLMRVLSSVNAFRNALRFSSSLPVTAAGSRTPQCAVIGCPGRAARPGAFACPKVQPPRSTRFKRLPDSIFVAWRQPSASHCSASSTSKNRRTFQPRFWPTDTMKSIT